MTAPLLIPAFGIGIGACLVILCLTDSSYVGLTLCFFCPPGARSQWPPACPGELKERCSSSAGHAPHHPDQHLCDHLLLLTCSLIAWLSLDLSVPQFVSTSNIKFEFTLRECVCANIVEWLIIYNLKKKNVFHVTMCHPNVVHYKCL